ncbi:MAG TPA: gamma-glutamyl-gamma-aminobutyrate hydrolase family protein, partial [Planctomycetaceae bacterium]|nr:gamma-glutamyl-gamma-aminobutyrate hydrolase family protein [Planctomycetaceae bacterium]
MTAVHIGLTPYGRDKDARFWIPAIYLDTVRAAGGIPILLAPGEVSSEALLTGVKGLLLVGGGDINPTRYGSAGHPEVYGVNDERDEFEIQLSLWAIEHKFPLFGICRGLQLINVALGGTLIEDLPDLVGEEIIHRLPPRLPVEHDIQLTADSHLAQILQKTEFSSSSSHHQAIRDIAPQLRVAARAPDDTIEAVEMAEHP